eukprot:3967904-Prymnesium_polylepis.1
MAQAAAPTAQSGLDAPPARTSRGRGRMRGGRPTSTSHDVTRRHTTSHDVTRAGVGRKNTQGGARKERRAIAVNTGAQQRAATPARSNAPPRQRAATRHNTSRRARGLK